MKGERQLDRWRTRKNGRWNNGRWWKVEVVVKGRRQNEWIDGGGEVSMEKIGPSGRFKKMFPQGLIFFNKLFSSHPIWIRGNEFLVWDMRKTFRPFRFLRKISMWFKRDLNVATFPSSFEELEHPRSKLNSTTNHESLRMKAKTRKERKGGQLLYVKLTRWRPASHPPPLPFLFSLDVQGNTSFWVTCFSQN